MHGGRETFYTREARGTRGGGTAPRIHLPAEDEGVEVEGRGRNLGLTLIRVNLRVLK